MRGQGYDGAANMFGKFRGVQAIVRERVSTATHEHCKAHQLNLALIHSSKEPCVRNMMGIVHDIAFAFDYSAKRLNAFATELSNCDENVKEAMEKRSTLTTLCETRWSARADSLFTFKSAFPVVVHALEYLRDNRDEKAGAYLTASVINDSDYNTMETVVPIMSICFVNIVFNIMEFDATFIQVRGLASNKTRFNPPFITLENSCTNSIQNAVSKIENKSSGVAKSKAGGHRRLLDDPEFIVAFRTIVEDNYLNDTIQDELLQVYSPDLPDVNTWEQEVTRWKVKFSDIPKTKLPGTLKSSLKQAHQDFYPNIRRIFVLLLTMPVTSVCCKRSFSGLRRLKTWKRSTMGEERLCGLAMLHTHRDKDVSRDDILLRFDRTGHRWIGKLTFD
ncbi:52 kDa repressor of the inhibitor of the protein kinase-like [Mytilus edulis]|uniref:52 kDa repressor of the inhibitor of the protein kinase-like n=1 Tax=Mytilus edulis TaxID=6550 RepID=UPI0039EFA753